MKIAVNREAFATALSETSSVAATRTPKPVLQCVMIRTDGKVVVVMATDLETSLRVAVPQVEVTEPGDALVPADKIASIVRESRDDVVHLETDGRTCHIRGEDSHFQVYVQDPQDYPPVPDMDGSPDLLIPAKDLARAISYTHYAAAKENTRFAINGILWKKRDKHVQLVATDGRRLAVCAVKVSGEDGPKEAIVPLKAMMTLQRIIAETEEDVQVKVAPNQVIARAGQATLSSVLVEGHFPKFEDVIPNDNDKRVEMDAAELQRAIRRAALLTTHESRGVRMSFSKGELELTSRAPEQGEARITVPIEYDAEALAIGFNPAFLLDVLKAVDAERITMEFKEANRPGVLKVGKDFTYVVMPVNLS